MIIYIHRWVLPEQKGFVEQMCIMMHHCVKDGSSYVEKSSVTSFASNLALTSPTMALNGNLRPQPALVIAL